jgi:peroxiredoxin (alkyl hydroperoxide reductase subunit C)
VLRDDGMAERALFVIDRQGVIRHIHVSDINKRPPLDTILRALDALPAP